MEENALYGIVYNPNLSSSMKYMSLKGLTKRDIILKYENLVYQRENQIKRLSLQLGELNQNLCNVTQTIELLQSQNKLLNNDIIKNNNLLKQELTDKDILFNKLNNMINENDKLKNMLNGKGKIKEKKRNHSVNNDVRAQVKKSKTVIVNNSESNIIEEGIDNVINVKTEKNEVKKKIKHKKENSDKNGKNLLKMKKPKKLASENIEYEPIFK